MRTNVRTDAIKSPSQSALEKLPHKMQVLFACFCAEQVFNLVLEKDKLVCRVAIDTARAFAFGESNANDAYAAAYAAADAAAYAAYAAAYAAYAAANAAYAAANAANAAAYAKDKMRLIKDQWSFYEELLFFDDNVEKILLKNDNE